MTLLQTARQASPTSEEKLSNGIPVIFYDSDAPVAATYWWISVGSADERKGEEGFAHFLEHMLFKDAAAKESGAASTGQTARAIESLGGEINAYTSFDQTVYHVTCAAQHWEKIIDSFGSMAGPQKFLKTDFVREREVILEELRKNEDSPNRQHFQTLFSTTFKKHPYGRPVIGFVRTLKAATVGSLEAFYKRNYMAAKMGLILVGPLGDPARRAKILKQLEKYYGSKPFPKKSVSIEKRSEEAAVRGAVTVVKKPFKVQSPAVSLSFRVPDLRHEDIPALDLITNVLGMGESSRLYQNLFCNRSWVTEVSAGLYVPKDPGMLYFHMEFETNEKIADACAEAFREMRRLAQDGPTPAELQRVLTNTESERLYATQTADGMAGRLGFLRFLIGDLAYDREYLEQLKAVDQQKIREVVERYFDYRRLNVALLLPKEQEAQAPYDTAAIIQVAESLLTPQVAPVMAPKSKASVLKTAEKRPYEQWTTPAGVRVIFRERPHSQVLSVHACALGGLRLELASPVDSAERDWGSSTMLSHTWTKGTPSKSAKAIAEFVEGKAAGLDGFSGRNTVGMQLTCLSRDWKPLTELFTEILTQPEFAREEVEHSRRVAEESVRGIEDHSSHLCSKLFLETLFENHPYGKLTTGSLESLKTIDAEKLRAFHRAWIRPDRLVVSVVGAISRANLDHFLASLDRALLAVPDFRGPSSSVAAELALKGPRWVERALGREQLHILVGGLGLAMGSPDRNAMRMISTILGGQSGRLFIELREKKSLAYTVAPVSFEGVEPGYVGTYIACSPQKKDEALAGIRHVLERLAEKGPSASEIKRAQEFFLGRRAMDLQSDSSLASFYGLEAIYGLKPDSEAEAIRKVRSVSAKDVQRVCRRFLLEPHQVTSVVG